MLAAQYALKCHQPSHPNFDLTTVPPPPRNIRNSVINRYHEAISHLPRPTSHRRLNEGNKHLHTFFVEHTIEGLSENRVLRSRPPNISKDEKNLPRNTRSTLSQLRSGWCKKLNSYKARIDDSIPDACPDCGNSPHDVNHIFSCPTKPTTLTTSDLWKHPGEVANFLGITNDEQDDD